MTPDHEDLRDADFYASLPQDLLGGPRTSSRSILATPRSVEELVVLLSRVPTGWIWRGQGSFTWPLETRLGRDFKKLPPVSPDPGVSYDYIQLENRVIGFFKERARRSLVHPLDDLDLLGWLATMQHYGAPTRLLDWTSSPFVGLWFAYSGFEHEPAALWGINAYFCRREVSGSLVPGGWDHLGIIRSNSIDADGSMVTSTPALETRQRDKENELLRWVIRANCRWPVPVIPFDTDARMTAQQTVLTCIGDLHQPVDRRVLRYAEWRSDQPAEPPPGGYREGTESAIWPLQEPADLLVKIYLPRDWRRDALDILAGMGIDASTLFPGLDGVGRQTSIYLNSGNVSIREVITDAFHF